MAAIWLRSFDQFRDINGNALPGAIAYFFDGGTTTPRVVYQDNALTTPWGATVTADANGYFPGVYLPPGLYNFTVTSSTGVQIVSAGPIDPMPYVATGGGGTPVDPTTIFQTGDALWMPFDGVRTGWVRDNGRTIGNASSGALERANADTAALFAFYWNNYSDALCPVSGGRGSSATADFAANKTIQTLDLRGFSPAGLDTMGNSAANRLASVPVIAGTTALAGSRLGAALHTLSVGEMPNHNHALTFTDPGHSHTYTFKSTTGGSNAGGDANSINNTTLNTSTSTTGISISLAATGGSGAHNNTPLIVLGTFFRKL